MQRFYLPCQAPHEAIVRLWDFLLSVALSMYTCVVTFRVLVYGLWIRIGFFRLLHMRRVIALHNFRTFASVLIFVLTTVN
jgi:hypothetical protein